MRKGNAAQQEFTEDVARAAILLRDYNYDDVAEFLLAKEKESRKPTRRAKRKVAVRSSTGRAARGGAFWIDGVDLARGERIEEP